MVGFVSISDDCMYYDKDRKRNLAAGYDVRNFYITGGLGPNYFFNV